MTFFIVLMKISMSNAVAFHDGNDALKTIAMSFVVLFSIVHVVDSARKKELCDNGYFATLTVFTLLLTAYATAVRCPPALVAAILAINVVVCAIYYGVMNQSYVGGVSFLLHGGCAMILAVCVWSGHLIYNTDPLTAAAACAVLLIASSLFQLRHEQIKTRPLYPSCKNFENPLWRTVIIPITGAVIAACIARAARMTP